MSAFLNVEHLVTDVLLILPSYITVFLKLRISMQRLNVFLKHDDCDLSFYERNQKDYTEEGDTKNVKQLVKAERRKKYDVVMKNGNFKWNATQDESESSDSDDSSEDEEVENKALETGWASKVDFTKEQDNKIGNDVIETESNESPILTKPKFKLSDIRVDLKTLKKEKKKEAKPGFELTNINFKVRKNQLVIIIGRIASGKSSLLYALQGEMTLNNPADQNEDEKKAFCQIHNDIAFIPQNPWLMSKSIKENIILNKEFDKEKFARACKLSALESDLDLFEEGVEKNVGENGQFLSGGQKQRVALAMCIYQDQQLYLMDDPTSALDAEKASEVFENTIVKELKNKTRVIVTHSTQFLKHADYIYVMEGGEIVNQGEYGLLYGLP